MIDKKRKKSGQIGKRYERKLAKILAVRFNMPFSRTVGSGNRWSQASLPKHAEDTYAGDLVCPEGFLWVLECKGGYDDLDLYHALVAGNAQLDEFLDQAQHEAEHTGRKPMLCWQRPRRPWLAFTREAELPPGAYRGVFNYQGWSAVALDQLLLAEDKHFLRQL